MDYIEARSDAKALLTYIELFRECFPAATHYTRDYLEWLYQSNPAGTVVGYDAWDGNTLAAHYACVPAALTIDGRPQRGLLSLNTATRPAYQGKGLFTRLAEATYESGAHRGFSCVYGVANASSTPGFVRKLGFRLVRPLDALIGFGRLGVSDLAVAHQSASFRRDWSTNYLSWRVSNPANPVETCRLSTGQLGLAASAHRFKVVAWSELPSDIGSTSAETGLTSGMRPRLFLGLLPDGVKRESLYRAIPQRLRPSPLNLIFRALGNSALQIDAAGTFFTFLDFDAY